jgi:hypothetical protein
MGPESLFVLLLLVPLALLWVIEELIAAMTGAV